MPQKRHSIARSVGSLAVHRHGSGETGRRRKPGQADVHCRLLLKQILETDSGKSYIDGALNSSPQRTDGAIDVVCAGSLKTRVLIAETGLEEAAPQNIQYFANTNVLRRPRQSVAAGLAAHTLHE